MMGRIIPGGLRAVASAPRRRARRRAALGVLALLVWSPPGIAQRDLVLLLDRSGSMAGPRLARQASAASLLVDLVADGDRAAVVSFGNDVRLDVAPLTLMGAGPRETIARTVSGLTALGASPLGDGLDLARTTLGGLPQPRSAPSIVLFTDGGDSGSARDPLGDVLPDLVQAGIQVHAIALSELADQALLIELAERTGGSFCLAPDEETLLRSVVDLAPLVTPGTRVDRFERDVATGGVWTRTHRVDGTSGSLTVAIVTGSAADEVDLELLRPDGFLLDPVRAQTIPEVTFFAHGAARGYRIDRPRRGLWTSRVRGRLLAGGVTAVRLDVGLTGPVAAILATVSDPTPTLPDPVRFTVRVGDVDPLVGLTVFALVEDPNGVVQRVALRDEGSFLDGDPVRGDGEYNARFFGFTVAGLHRVSVRAEGVSPRRVSGVSADPLQRFAALLLDAGGDLLEEEGFLRVDALRARVSAERPERNGVDLTASFDLDRSLGDPELDILEVGIGALVETFDPGTLERRGDRYLLREGERRVDLALFRRNSSFGRLRVRLSNFESTAFGALDVVPVEIALGAFRRRLVLRPGVASAGRVSWRRGRHPMDSEQWIVDRLRLSDAGDDRGRVDVALTLSNVLLDPTLDAIGFSIGNFGLRVPPGAWEGSGAHYRFRLREGTRDLEVVLDLDAGSYRMRGRGLDLGEPGSPLSLVFSAGAYQRRLEVLATRRGTNFRYGG